MASLLRGDSERDSNFDDEWPNARPTVIRLLNQNNVSKAEWQDLFRLVFNMHSWAKDGTERVRQALSSDIDEYVLAAEKRINQHSGKFELLRVYIEEWSRFYTQANILPLPFKVIEGDSKNRGVNRYERPEATTQKSVREVMLDIWNRRIFEPICSRLLLAVKCLIEQERNGESFNADAVVGVRESFVALNDKPNADDPDAMLSVYRKTFEHAYIEDTVQYYSTRAASALLELGIYNYMDFADKKLEEEEKRARKYLHPTPDSINKLIESCVKVLVITFEDLILDQCPVLIKNNDIDRLKMLYRLVKRTPRGIPSILKYTDEYIRTEGLNDMKNNAEIITVDPEKYVTQLLDLYEKFSNLVRDGFYDDARLLTARDKAFREIVNDTSIFRMELPISKKSRNIAVESKCPELLANYCDLLLRKTALSKKLTSEEIDEKLNNLLLVLKYVNNKDVFMRFHKAHLSRRLILDMSADQDKEEYVVNRLRAAGMPAEHVNKLSRMLQDIELNKDLSNLFKKSLTGTNNNKACSDLINLKVLNGGAWGRGGTDKVRLSLPRELEDYVPEVENFYKKSHNGRKLTWMHHWSSGTMTFGTANGGRFDLDVTTFQMSVLFVWNERAHEKISFETMRLATELPDTELARTLYSLVANPKMKYQVLLTDSSVPINPRDFNDSTLFWINHDFHLIKNGKVQMRGRTNLIGKLQLSMESNASKEHEDIVALREFRVQEAIVKIMKMRKTATSAQLQTELVELLKPMFLPNRKLIKEQIDWLIENKFIERKENDMNTFIYLS